MPEIPTSTIARLLIAVGIVTLVIGLLLLLWPRIPMIGRLPGDITIQKDGFRLFVPIASSIIISIVLTVIVNVVLRLVR